MKKILIIRCGALGDLVYSTSVLDALKFEFGEDITIDYISTPAASKLFEYDKRVNKIFHLKHKKIPIIFSSQKKAVINYSKKEPYDILINFEMGKQFKSLVEKIVANKKVGWFCEDIKITKTHMVEICKEFYSTIISKENLDKAFPKIFGSEFNKVKNKFSLPNDYMIVSPSNSHNKKKRLNYRAWPHEHWKEFLNLVPRHISIILIGAQGEEEFFEPLKPYNSNIIDLVGKITISEMVSVIEKSKALIVTDTGTAHIASAVNTPVFCLIGPTPAKQTGPYKTPFNEVHIINAELSCSPCYKTDVMKACKDNICMKNIKPSSIINALNQVKIL
ncbi:glycosyltransferase family 9 protein [Aliarcobacter skirrowii]|uniref:glycosyltransferase family 9 protein n=1 Tax=Aliarcobacter skirrowii TaxID=28200 RepID=UPI0029A12F60|nr:glycosyltransferase family 9 protein [Aliarcobacter skirrowii]MDX4064312.1 glycosyltransferase family 9 protein [Aliarcobacter skirrowii]